jgi:hypothetical protein
VQKDVARTLVDAFRKGGASEEGIAAVLANVQSESGFKPWSKGAAGEIGLFQYLGAEQQRYLGWLKKNHPDANWADPKLQAEYQVQNLKDNYKDLWKELTGHTGAGRQAADYVSGYEHPKRIYEIQRRAQYLRGVHEVPWYIGDDDKPPEATPPKTATPPKPGGSHFPPSPVHDEKVSKKDRPIVPGWEGIIGGSAAGEAYKRTHRDWMKHYTHGDPPEEKVSYHQHQMPQARRAPHQFVNIHVNNATGSEVAVNAWMAVPQPSYT